MAITAENLATKYGITRADCDAYALSSQQRWAAAQREGRLQGRDRRRSRSRTRRAPIQFAVDEHPRPQTTLETLAQARRRSSRRTASSPPATRRASATARRASSSPPRSSRRRKGLKPLARLVQWGVAGVDPTHHGHRPRAGDPERARARRAEAVGHRSLRGQRGVRAAVPRGREGARSPARQDQRERRRHRARPPARRERRAHHHAPRLRARASQRPLRGRQRVHRRRPGPRRRPRARVPTRLPRRSCVEWRRRSRPVDCERRRVTRVPARTSNLRAS